MLLKYKDYKMLSKDDMKKIKGGDEGGGGGCPPGYYHATVECMDLYTMPSPNLCANSSFLCNAHGGFKACYCWN